MPLIYETDIDLGQATFGHAQLGDRRRTARLVETFNLMRRHPGGTLPDKLSTPADLRLLPALRRRRRDARSGHCRRPAVHACAGLLTTPNRFCFCMTRRNSITPRSHRWPPTLDKSAGEPTWGTSAKMCWRSAPIRARCWGWWIKSFTTVTKSPKTKRSRSAVSVKHARACCGCAERSICRRRQS